MPSSVPHDAVDDETAGKLKGKQPKLSPRQRVHVLKLVQGGDHTIAELTELFAVSRATIYREIARARLPHSVR